MISRKPLPQTYDPRTAAAARTPTPNSAPDTLAPPAAPGDATASVETNPFKKRLVASATGSSTASAAGSASGSTSGSAPAPPPLPKAPRPESNLLIFEPGELQEAARAEALANSQPPTIPEGPSDEWNVVGNGEQPEVIPLSRQSSWENFTDDDDDDDKDKDKADKGKANATDETPAKQAVPGPSSAPEVVQPDQPATAPELVLTAVPPIPIQSSAPEVVPSRQPTPARSLLDDADDVAPPPGPPPTAPAQPPRPAETAKTETYQVKIIRWNDGQGSANGRESPILLQNKNGPCPLVALVNALSLSTPAASPTALVDILKSREQVSLSLVLDAMFEDLVSGRTSGGDGDGDDQSEMPDVGELYSFLQGLHTGMNVNPRFLPTTAVLNAYKRTSLQHLHPSMRVRAMPGTFEDTREMQLYATFGIPLIHGWLPSREADAVVCEALVRQSAPSYDSVQNLFFHESELETKLLTPRPGADSGDSGLTPEEQTLYQDVLTIKAFLAQSATQLTPYGIEAVATSMRPGTISILFRNDHFSTLYRHPETMQLMVLVTDAGYATHEEIVWETLVDVRGERAEFYSGDFRLVGGATHDAAAAAATTATDTTADTTTASASHDAGWTTVQNSRHGRTSQSAGSHGSLPTLTVETGGPSLGRQLSRDEQEDRDLALALQLQEEEEEQHRAEEARRRRESQLSEQFIEQQARQRPASGASPNRVGSDGGNSGNSGNGGNRNSSRPGNSSQTHVGPRHSSAGHNYYLGGGCGPSLSPSSSSGRTGGGGGPRRSTSSVASSPAAASAGSLSATPSRYRGRSSTGTAAAAGAGTTSSSSSSAAMAALTAASGLPLSTAAAASISPQPLLAIRPSPRPAVHRPPAEDDDEAPPSYEEAAQEAPYHPPGEELSPSQQRAQMLRASASVGGGGRGRGSGSVGNTNNLASTTGSVRRTAQNSFPGASMIRPGVYAQQPLAGRQQQMQQYQQQQYLRQQYEDAQLRERDRDCVIM